MAHLVMGVEETGLRAVLVDEGNNEHPLSPVQWFNSSPVQATVDEFARRVYKDAEHYAEHRKLGEIQNVLVAPLTSQHPTPDPASFSAPAHTLTPAQFAAVQHQVQQHSTIEKLCDQRNAALTADSLDEFIETLSERNQTLSELDATAAEKMQAAAEKLATLRDSAPSEKKPERIWVVNAEEGSITAVAAQEQETYQEEPIANITPQAFEEAPDKEQKRHEKIVEKVSAELEHCPAEQTPDAVVLTGVAGRPEVAELALPEGESTPWLITRTESTAPLEALTQLHKEHNAIAEMHTSLRNASRVGPEWPQELYKALRGLGKTNAGRESTVRNSPWFQQASDEWGNVFRTLTTLTDDLRAEPSADPTLMVGRHSGEMALAGQRYHKGRKTWSTEVRDLEPLDSVEALTDAALGEELHQRFTELIEAEKERPYRVRRGEETPPSEGAAGYALTLPPHGVILSASSNAATVAEHACKPLPEYSRGPNKTFPSISVREEPSFDEIVADAAAVSAACTLREVDPPLESVTRWTGPRVARTPPPPSPPSGLLQRIKSKITGR